MRVPKIQSLSKLIETSGECKPAYADSVRNAVGHWSDPNEIAALHVLHEKLYSSDIKIPAAVKNAITDILAAGPDGSLKRVSAGVGKACGDFVGYYAMSLLFSMAGIGLPFLMFGLACPELVAAGAAAHGVYEAKRD